MISMLALLPALLKQAPSAAAAKKPHILMVLIDDLGFAELGYHRPPGYKEVVTPEIDQLVAQGAALDRFYVHKFCSPTRSAIQTGRAPIHVNVVNTPPEWHNASDPVSGFGGIPRNMTGIATVMREAGYSTHYSGKWDVGMATPDHLPAGRGYESSLFYFHHCNDYWTFRERDVAQICQPDEPDGMIDLWNDPPYTDNPSMPAIGGPARGFVNSPTCNDTTQHPVGNATGDATCVYEDELFENRVHDVLRGAKRNVGDKPLFVFWATHIVHGPLQVPDAYYEKFEKLMGPSSNPTRAKYHAMVNYIDGSIGRVVTTLKEEGLYNDTLICFCSDNGGPLPSGNNYPLKGGKFSDWEGGIRVNAFVSGGFLPTAMRGTVITGLMAGWDWYATWAHLAGVDDITDHRAAKANLPGVESINMWGLLSGSTKASPRTQVAIGSNLGGDEHYDPSGRTEAGMTTVAGLLRPPYKLLLGLGLPGDIMDMAGHPGPQSPNNSVAVNWRNITQTCGRTPETGCLYDVYNDPSEYNNLASTEPAIWHEMMAMIQELDKDVFSPVRGVDDGTACKQAGRNGGFWGPYLK